MGPAPMHVTRPYCEPSRQTASVSASGSHVHGVAPSARVAGASGGAVSASHGVADSAVGRASVKASAGAASASAQSARRGVIVVVKRVRGKSEAAALMSALLSTSLSDLRDRSAVADCCHAGV
jgi:hypothetical protein